MKLVVISHACTTPVNQLPFQDIAALSGWDVTIILPARWRSDYVRDQPTKQHPAFHGKLIKVDTWFTGNIPLHAYHFSLFAALRREQPDLIYVQNESYALSTFQIMVFCRFFAHRRVVLYASQTIRKAYPWLFRQIEKFNLKSSPLAVALSDTAARCLREKGFTGQTVTLPLGVRQIPPEAPRPPPGGKKIIGYVGRLVPEKGVDVLLNALALLKADNWACRIIGAGPQADTLMRIAADLGLAETVTFRGYIDHEAINAELKNLSLLVLPSRSCDNWMEQFGRVLVEALAVQVPVIGSDSGEIPFVINQLQGGIIVPEGDVAALAQAIDDLLADEEKSLAFGRRGMENVREHFLEAVIAQRFVDEVLLPSARSFAPRADL